MTTPLLSHGHTYGEIVLSRGADSVGHVTWTITDIEPHVAIRLKQLFPRIGKTARVPFVLTGGPQLDADLRWFLSRYPMRLTEADARRMAERTALFETGQAELGSILSPAWAPPATAGFRDGVAPWAYQVQAAEIARRTGRLLLMDEMGLGKTVSAIAAVLHPDLLPALVLCELHLVDQWVEKIAEFTALRTHVIKQTTPYALPTADVLVCAYSKLGGWIDYAEQAGFKSVVLDEIQSLRGGTGTIKGAAAMAFCRAAVMRVGLSGTPIYNYGEEMWRVMQFLEEGCLGDWPEFVIEWCAPGPGGKWIVKEPAALGTYLRETHLALRRTRGDVGHERAFPNVIVHDIDTDAEALEAGADLAEALARQVVSGTFTERGQAARELDMRLRHATGVAKARHVAAFVRILLEAGEQVLLAGWHRDVYDMWLAELGDWQPAMYTGTESPARKRAAKEAFLAGTARVLIISNRSGAGLDGLQAVARVVVHGELDWSPKVHEQITARLDRPGQQHQVDAIYLVARDGSDPAIVGVLGLKASQSHGIVDPLSAPAEQPSDTSRIRALAEMVLERARRGEPAPRPVPTLVRVEEPAQPALL